MKSLVKNGFIRRQDLDFTDDGSRFQAYEYNGLVITKTTYQGEYYISIRVDYDKELNYYDYHIKNWYNLTDKFNGVSSVDVDELKQTMDIIAEGVKQLKEEISKEKIDWTDFDNRANNEIKQVNDFIEKHRNIDLLSIKDTYKIERIAKCLQGLKREIEILTISLKSHKRYDYKFFKEHGYIRITNVNKNYYAEEILENL